MKVYEIQRAISPAEVALYIGEVSERREELGQRLRKASNGHVGKAAAELRSLSNWMLGRLALESSESISTRIRALIRKSARQLDAEHLGLFAMWARLLEAGLASREGDASGARSMLRRAIKVGEDHDVEMFVACARFQLSRLLSGDAADAARSQSMEWMRAEGIVEPERFARIYVSGFG